MRLLLVEDDDRIAAFVEKGLREAGYAVDRAADGVEGLRLAATEEAGRYAAAIVDLMLPQLDGIGLIERLRERGSDVPLLILSARREVDDRVRGLRAGGDDYLTKPFAFAELLARIEALVRRSRGGVAEPTRLAAGPLAVDLLTREVTRADERLDLQPREYELLTLFLRHAGHVVSKTMILDEVWGYDFDPRTNAVDVLVHRVRKKVDEPFEPKLIETIRGVGYVLRIPDPAAGRSDDL